MKPRPRPKPPGVEWVVFKTLRVPVHGRDGRPKRLFGGKAALTVERIQKVGSVFADTKEQAQVLARAYYGDRLTVQSALSARLTTEAESVVASQRHPVSAVRAQRATTAGASRDTRSRGRPYVPRTPSWAKDVQAGKALLARERKGAS